MAPTQPRSREDWGEVIDRIQVALAQWLEKTPETPLADPQPEAGETVHDSLAALGRRLGDLHSSLEKAEVNAAETDALLRGEIETFEQWVAQLKQVREKLATWVAEPAA